MPSPRPVSDEEMTLWMRTYRATCRYKWWWLCTITYPDLAPSIHRLVDLVDRFHALGEYDLTLQHLWFDPFYYDLASERDRFQKRLYSLALRIRAKLGVIRARHDTPPWMSQRIEAAARLLHPDQISSFSDTFDTQVRKRVHTLVYSLVDLQMCHRRLRRCVVMGDVAMHLPPDVDEWAHAVAKDHPRFGGYTHRSVAHFDVKPKHPTDTLHQ